VKPVFFRTTEVSTGAAAALVYDKERSLMCDTRATEKYPTTHLIENIEYLNSASFAFSTGYFIDSNSEALKKVCTICCEQDKPMIFSLAGTYVIEGNYEDMMEAVEYSDFIFCNKDEGIMMAEKHGKTP
jgi:sugar/nucleoside kinase (ribokinase family)